LKKPFWQSFKLKNIVFLFAVKQCGNSAAAAFREFIQYAGIDMTLPETAFHLYHNPFIL